MKYDLNLLTELHPVRPNILAKLYPFRPNMLAKGDKIYCFTIDNQNPKLSFIRFVPTTYGCSLDPFAGDQWIVGLTTEFTRTFLLIFDSNALDKCS